jgi:hypothetical protein
MSLRARSIEETATLPDGRTIVVRVGLPRDSYIKQSDLDTVEIELRERDRSIAVVNTVLDADQDDEARELAREVTAGLASGELEPTAGAIEPLADRLR